MRNVPFTLITLLLYSCILFRENGIDVNITNTTEQSITNIVVKTSENTNSLVIERLGPKESISGFLKMTHAKTDGSYVVLYNKASGQTIETVGGYYSNGISFLELMRIEIQQDTALIHFTEKP
ncbi:hypothetical protein [Maribacter aurantiacus]|uniref:Uncharacterized protein n=1 Tax=Maribacter aurantiacus TaxID=1882343 RepID=A0A5R8M395_9FLAO|nr:hypothetical protein [Maribacter aurantiacus]TLF44098.1 hypothetical protein FEK29_13570 [Maribacter aurantiacus]